MSANNFLTFASASGALVESDAAYASDASRLLGFQNGIADPAHLNKAWRQGAAGSAVIGQAIADHALVDANDDGDIPTLKANFRIAMAAMLAGAAFGQDTSSTPNAIVVALDPAPPTLTAFRSLFVRIANTNTGPVTIAFNALGSKTATRRDGTPLQAGDLSAGQFAHFVYDSQLGQWVLGGFASGEIQRIAGANTTLFVRPDGSDTNNGSANTASAAFATIAAAIAYGTSRFSLAGGTLIIKLGVPSTYAAPNVIPPTLGTLLIQGDINNQNGYGIAGAGPSALTSPVFVTGGKVILSGVVLLNTGTLNATLNVGSGAQVVCQSVTFNSNMPSANPHFQASGGSITIGSGCAIFSSMANIGVATSAGNIAIAANLAIANSPNFTSASFLATDRAGIALSPGYGFTGSGATGQRYNVSFGGIIKVFGAGPNALPGSIAGSADNTTGGYYA